MASTQYRSSKFTDNHIHKVLPEFSRYLSILSLILISSALLTTNAVANSNTSYVQAKVMEAEPIIRLVSHSTPRQSCWDEHVVVRNRQSSSPTGAILGGIIGAAIGNEVGHDKRNKQVGVVAGALLGSAVGNDISRANAGEERSRVVTERQCKTLYDTYEEEQVMGYRVVYQYNGFNYHTTTRQHPGDTLRLKVSITPLQH